MEPDDSELPGKEPETKLGLEPIRDDLLSCMLGHKNHKIHQRQLDRHRSHQGYRNRHHRNRHSCFRNRSCCNRSYDERDIRIHPEGFRHRNRRSIRRRRKQRRHRKKHRHRLQQSMSGTASYQRHE